MPVVHTLDQLPEGLNTHGRDIEGMLIVDLTYSMLQPTRKGGRQRRIDLARDVARVLATRSTEFDSQAAAEQQAGAKEGEDTAGGIRTTGFGTTDSESNPQEAAWDFGDLNEENFDRQWDRIMGQLHGRFTVIMPGFVSAFETFSDEFGSLPITERPIAGIVMIIDGEAEDAQAVADEAMKLKGDVRLVVVVVGYGAEHDAAVKAFEKDAEGNPNIVLLSLSGEQDPDVVGDALAKLLGLDEDD